MKENNVFPAVLFGVALLGFNLYGLMSGSYHVQLLINLDMLIVYARIALVVALLTYAFVPALRTYTARNLLYAGGALMIILGIGSLMSATFVAYTAPYILLADSLLLVQAGIVSLILCVDLPARRSRFIAQSYHYMQSLIPASRPEALNPHVTSIKIKTFKSKPLLNNTAMET